MTSTNTATVDGYLGRDSELRFSQSGMAFLNFSVAVKSQQKSGNGYVDRTDWIDVKCIGKRAEALVKILVKGTFCVVTGKLQQETWEKDGQKRSKIVLFAENVSLGPRVDGGRKHQPEDDVGGQEWGNDSAGIGDSGGGATDMDDLPFSPVGDVG